MADKHVVVAAADAEYFQFQHWQRQVAVKQKSNAGGLHIIDVTSTLWHVCHSTHVQYSFQDCHILVHHLMQQYCQRSARGDANGAST